MPSKTSLEQSLEWPKRGRLLRPIALHKPELERRSAKRHPQHYLTFGMTSECRFPLSNKMAKLFAAMAVRKCQSDCKLKGGILCCDSGQGKSASIEPTGPRHSYVPRLVFH
jgi:hypothetical protein